MKLNSTVALTLVLLTAMLAAGLVSAAFGLTLGREALKGITQPDTRPTNNLANRKGKPARQSDLVILREEDILKSVKAHVDGGAAKAADSTPTAANKADNAAVRSRFPIVAQDQGVTLEIKSTQQEDSFLVLNVTLRNNGNQAVQFLYSDLEVTDDRGQILNAKTEGLPGELPSKSQTFSGTIRVPSELLEKVEKISLALTDYPDQQLKLKAPDVPIVK
ncbi:hypothetical protein ACN4EK_23620 [Pantanalinema rosaneae CENA516]|uniref:hypothetical protein n=1 Tax=Pantanalinema rosaneae TaxID=1620701 RepID=UPI003D6EBEE3